MELKKQRSIMARKATGGVTDNFKYVVLLLVLLANSSCRIIELTYYPDPYSESFYNKGLKYLISDGETIKSSDTTEFDSYGNIIRIRKYWSEQFFSYNAYRYPTHILTINDAPTNFIITYSRDHNKLLQYWFEVEHYNWEVDLFKDLKSSPNFIIEYTVNKSGLISESIDVTGNRRTLYFYNKKDQLVAKRIFSLEDKQLITGLKFRYWNNSQIREINIEDQSKDFATHFFSNDGLLESTIFSKDEIVEYRYVYF